MSKRLRIKLNLLVRRTWSNLTDSFYLNHIAASSTFLAISSTTSTYTGSTVSCTSSQAVPTTPGMHSTVYIYLHIHRITVWRQYIHLFQLRLLPWTNFHSLQYTMVNPFVAGSLVLLTFIEIMETICEKAFKRAFKSNVF